MRQQYEIERELADRLRRSTRAERPELLRGLYTELRRRAPEHPRLNNRDAPEQIVSHVASQMRLLHPWLNMPSVFLEFAPGAGRLATNMCRHAGHVYGVDISDQLAPDMTRPKNFELLVYDGFTLDLPDNYVDLMFSYQMIEHIHPDDVPLHFSLALRLLKPDGIYVFATPHAFSGPHDISRYFSRTPRGLHLKEWTYAGLTDQLRRAGFAQWHICRRGRYHTGRAMERLMIMESMAEKIPTHLRRFLCRRLFAGIVMAARKAA